MPVALAPLMVVTDLDGTLLDASGTRVSTRNAAALRRATAAGARVVVATGRPIWWLGPVVEAGLTGVAVCMNGAVTYDIGAGEITAASPIAPDVMRTFIDKVSAAGVGFGIAVERIGVGTGQAWAEPDYRHPWGDGLFTLADRDTLLSEPAAKMLLRGHGESSDLAEVVRAAGVDGVTVTYSSDDGLLEIAATGVNKGAALDRLARQWGIDPADVLAFGDMPNDLEMLAWAGRGVAMDNAHPDVLAVAGERAPHHDEDGVAAVLERWF